MKDITEKQLEYLKSKGWTVEEVKFPSERISHTYCHPIMAPLEKGGGYSDARNAWSVQEEQDAYDLGKCYYYFSRDNRGYGYSITERSPEGCRRLVFNHHDKDVAKEMHEKLKKDGKCDAVILDTTHVYHKVLILEEKHGSYHYYVPNLPCLFKTCRLIVMNRIEEGCWYEMEESDSPIEVPSMTKEDIEKLKDGPVKKAAKEEWDYFESMTNYRKKQKTERNAIKFIQENDNLIGGHNAFVLLNSRKSYEYEKFSIEEMEYVS